METDEDDNKGAAFEEFGEVLDSFNPVKGFAFVTFSTPEGATALTKAGSLNVSKPKVKPEAEKNEEITAGKYRMKA